MGRSPFSQLLCLVVVYGHEFSWMLQFKRRLFRKICLFHLTSLFRVLHPYLHKREGLKYFIKYQQNYISYVKSVNTLAWSWLLYRILRILDIRHLFLKNAATVLKDNLRPTYNLFQNVYTYFFFLFTLVLFFADAYLLNFSWRTSKVKS